MQSAKIVDRHDALEYCKIRLSEATTVGNPGIVDQYIDTAKMLQHLTDGLFTGLGVGHVTADRQYFGVQLVHQLLAESQKGFVLNVENRDTSAGLGKTQCQGAPDAGATAGNDYYFLLKCASGHGFSSPCSLTPCYSQQG